MTDIAVACHWGPSRAATWSGTPLRLLEALRAEAEVADLDVTLPTVSRQVLRLAAVRRTHGRWQSAWRHTTPALWAVERRLVQQAAGVPGVPVVEIGDLGVLPRNPFYVLQDLSYELLLREIDADGSVPHFRTLDRRRLERLAARQAEVYAAATGVIAMSSWLADSVERSGVPRERIHVVNPGVNVQVSDAPLPARRPGGRARLLFVGRDFDTKAGDEVVAAYALLRARMGESVTLTVAGPRSLPAGTPLPDGLDFRGPVPGTTVRALYEDHDLLVMPSRFEGFGIVFAEALSRGLPCVGRRACAMPEIIDGRSGDGSSRRTTPRSSPPPSPTPSRTTACMPRAPPPPRGAAPTTPGPGPRTRSSSWSAEGYGQTTSAPRSPVLRSARGSVCQLLGNEVGGCSRTRSHCCVGA